MCRPIRAARRHCTRQSNAPRSAGIFDSTPFGRNWTSTIFGSHAIDSPSTGSTTTREMLVCFTHFRCRLGFAAETATVPGATKRLIQCGDHDSPVVLVDRTRLNREQPRRSLHSVPGRPQQPVWAAYALAARQHLSPVAACRKSAFARNIERSINGDWGAMGHTSVRKRHTL